MVTAGNLEAAADAAEVTLEVAQQWASEPDIKAVISHDQVAALDTATETRERIIARYANIANADITAYFVPGTDYAAIKPPEELTAGQRAAIKKISHNQHGPILELHDAVRANDKLTEICALISDSNNDESADEKAKRIRTLLQEMEDVTTGVTTH
jgi:phage terminase small subunit